MPLLVACHGHGIGGPPWEPAFAAAGCIAGACYHRPNTAPWLLPPMTSDLLDNPIYDKSVVIHLTSSQWMTWEYGQLPWVYRIRVLQSGDTFRWVSERDSERGGRQLERWRRQRQRRRHECLFVLCRQLGGRLWAFEAWLLAGPGQHAKSHQEWGHWPLPPLPPPRLQSVSPHDTCDTDFCTLCGPTVSCAPSRPLSCLQRLTGLTFKFMSVSEDSQSATVQICRGTCSE